MRITANLQTPHRTIVSINEEIDIPFLQEILDNVIEIESLTVADSTSASHQNFILIGFSSKKLGDLKTEVEQAFKKRGAYVQLTYLAIRATNNDSNPSKRV